MDLDSIMGKCGAMYRVKYLGVGYGFWNCLFIVYWPDMLSMNNMF